MFILKRIKKASKNSSDYGSKGLEDELTCEQEQQLAEQNYENGRRQQANSKDLAYLEEALIGNDHELVYDVPYDAKHLSIFVRLGTPFASDADKDLDDANDALNDPSEDLNRQDCFKSESKRPLSMGNLMERKSSLKRNSYSRLKDKAKERRSLTILDPRDPSNPNPVISRKEFIEELRAQNRLSFDSKDVVNKV